MKISLIIKTLNEEEDVQRTIASAIEVTKGFDAEIVVADNGSVDNTVPLAATFPVKVIKSKGVKDTPCGVGAQLGYQLVNGDYIYILDGDMSIHKDFIKKGIAALQADPKLAGVAGMVKEMRSVNMVFKRRKKQGGKPSGYTNKLEMGGLYKKEALKDVGYFTNQFLHAYEEAELGHRLAAKGWKLKRLPEPGIEHYGYNTTTFGALRRRWKSRYVKGSGDYLRSALGKPYFFKVAFELKVYIGLIGLWAMFIICLALIPISKLFINYFGVLVGLLLLLFLIKKRDLKDFLFALAHWHYTSIGLIWGFFTPQPDPRNKIDYQVIR